MSYENIPAALRKHKAWLLWKYVHKDGEPKPRKIPCYAFGGKRCGTQGSPEDRKKLVTFDEALKNFIETNGQYNGLGFATLPEWGLVALDFDDCVKDGKVIPEVENLVKGTYAEFSPSGNGVRAFMTGTIDNKKSYSKDWGWGFETFNSKGFVTITGVNLPCHDLIGAMPLSPLTEEIKNLYQTRFKAKAEPISDVQNIFSESYTQKVGLSLTALEEHLKCLDPRVGQDEGWLKAGMAIHHETGGSKEGAELFDRWSSGAYLTEKEREMLDNYPGGQAVLERYKSFGKDGIRPVTARWLVKEANQKRAGKSPVFDSKDYMDIARKFIDARFQTEDGCSLIYAAGSWYEHNRTVYVDLEKEVIPCALRKYLETALKHNKDGAIESFKPNSHQIFNIVEALKAICFAPSTLPPMWLNGYNGPSPEDLVSLENGLLHIPTRRLIPHTVGFFTLNTLPYAWEETGEPKDWLKFLNSIWEDDTESIQTLQEIMGYLLTADTSQQKIFLIKGPPRSGKGTISGVLTGLLGSSNISSLSLHQLSGDFGLQPLIGKLVNIAADTRIDPRSNKQIIVENLLMLSGEDSITINRKNKEQLTMKLPTRFMILTNEAPQLGDASGAFVSRFIVLSMSHSFYGSEDLDLASKLKAELPQIFRWALDGKERLKKRGRFIQPKSGEDLLKTMEALNTPIRTFVDEKCDIGKPHTIQKDALYIAYSEWCFSEGRTHSLSKERFCENLLSTGLPIMATRPRSDAGGRYQAFQGIRLKERPNNFI